MTAPAANEPTPLVHNGIIYLVNTDNIVQALDGRTGDLIWENRLRPRGPPGGGTGAMRNMAIYQDKVFVSTTDAHLFAIDARTGKICLGFHGRGECAKGFGNSSGPIVIHGKSSRPERLRPLQSDEKEQGCFISAFDPANGKLLGASIPSRAKANPAETPGATCPTCCAWARKPGSPAVTILT